MYQIFLPGKNSIISTSQPMSGNIPWVRVTNVSGMEFSSILSADGQYRTILPRGTVTGIVSPPHQTVFVLAKVARRRDESPEPIELEFWRVSEAMVDASGNWHATVCGYHHLRSSQRPYFEFWEVMAVATSETQKLLTNAPSPTCSISTANLLKIKPTACSESKIVMRPPDDGKGTYLDEVRPQRRYICPHPPA